MCSVLISIETASFWSDLERYVLDVTYLRRLHVASSETKKEYPIIPLE